MSKKISLRIALLVLVGVVFGLSPFFSLRVCAVSNPTLTISELENTNPDRKNIEDTLININEVLYGELGFDDFFIVSYSNKIMTVEIASTRYKELPQETKQELMSICLNGIQNSNISATNRNKIYNFVADTDVTVASLVRQLSNDVQADFAGAYTIFKPFASPLGIFLGVLTILIFVLLGLSIVIDIAWLVIPGLQWLLMTSSKSEKPILVSVEAWEAYKQFESGNNVRKTPLSYYFKMKVKEYIVLGVCLLYLMSGKLYVLVGIIVDYFSGLLPN